MKPQECPFEAEVLRAIECCGERRIGPALEAHMAVCPVCSDLAIVAAAFEGARAEIVATADLPEAGRIWRRAQMRAQREAIRTAGHPITAAQVIAFGAAMGLIGASLGATSTRFQAFLAWAGAQWTAFDKIAWLTSATAFIAGNVAFIAGLAAAVVLLPAAVYVALRE